jgi:hypothetical protein
MTEAVQANLPHSAVRPLLRRISFVETCKGNLATRRETA